MPGCVLRAASIDFAVDEFLKTSTLLPCDVYRKGEPRGRNGKLYDKSGITVVVSEATGDELTRQIKDAIQFLEQNRVEITNLRNLVGSDGIALDFSIWNKEVFGQHCYFPPLLLRLAGELGLGIELSIYQKEL